MTAETRTFSVPAMSCNHCINAITASVTPLADIESVAIDLATKIVTVVGGDVDTIVAAIDEAGYDVA